MCELYRTSRTNVVEHIKHIYEEGELAEDATCRNFRQVRQEGARQVERTIPFYNLDMIIALGYRVRYNAVTREVWAEGMKEMLDDKKVRSLCPVRVNVTLLVACTKYCTYLCRK